MQQGAVARASNKLGPAWSALILRILRHEAWRAQVPSLLSKQLPRPLLASGEARLHGQVTSQALNYIYI